jgi:TolA-binding protein
MNETFYLLVSMICALLLSIALAQWLARRARRTAPTLDELRERSLQNARIELIDASERAEDWAAQVRKLRTRIDRLEYELRHVDQRTAEERACDALLNADPYPMTRRPTVWQRAPQS